jgi:hypothetical protein
MNVVKKGNKLIVEVTMQKPKLSVSRKTFVVATTRGAWESPVEIHGKPVKIILNAFIDADEPEEGNEEEKIEDLDPDENIKPQRKDHK